MPRENSKLNELIFYAIDKASPYDLARYPENDTLDKIMHMTLTQLSIPAPGIALMWLWINAHSGEFGAKPVPPKVSTEVSNVAQVKSAVYNTLNLTQ
jgi:hypothetical protein